MNTVYQIIEWRNKIKESWYKYDKILIQDIYTHTFIHDKIIANKTLTQTPQERINHIERYKKKEIEKLKIFSSEIDIYLEECKRKDENTNNKNIFSSYNVMNYLILFIKDKYPNKKIVKNLKLLTDAFSEDLLNKLFELTFVIYTNNIFKEQYYNLNISKTNIILNKGLSELWLPEIIFYNRIFDKKIFKEKELVKFNKLVSTKILSQINKHLAYKDSPKKIQLVKERLQNTYIKPWESWYWKKWLKEYLPKIKK